VSILEHTILLVEPGIRWFQLSLASQTVCSPPKRDRRVFFVLQASTSAMDLQVEGVEPGRDITRQCVISKERDRANHTVMVASLLTCSDDRRSVSDTLYDLA